MEPRFCRAGICSNAGQRGAQGLVSIDLLQLDSPMIHFCLVCDLGLIFELAKNKKATLIGIGLLWVASKEFNSSYHNMDIYQIIGFLEYDSSI